MRWNRPSREWRHDLVFGEISYAGKGGIVVFGEDDHVAWITRAEMHFEVQRFSEDSMETLIDHEIQRWSLGQSHRRDEGTEADSINMEEYITWFELYLSQCCCLIEQQVQGYFVGGLCHERHSRVRTFKLKSRYQAMQLASDVENEFAVLEQPGHQFESHLEPRQRSECSTDAIEASNSLFHRGLFG